MPAVVIPQYAVTGVAHHLKGQGGDEAVLPEPAGPGAVGLVAGKLDPVVGEFFERVGAEARYV